MDKMATISQTIFQLHFREWNVLYFSILIKISSKFVPNGPIDNNPAMV